MRFLDVVAQGDIKPVVLTNVTSTTGAAVVSATSSIFDNSTQTIISAPAAMAVAGTSITSSNYTWQNLGEFIVQIVVHFSDGIVDNSITIAVQVIAVPE